MHCNSQTKRWKNWKRFTKNVKKNLLISERKGINLKGINFPTELRECKNLKKQQQQQQQQQNNFS